MEVKMLLLVLLLALLGGGLREHGERVGSSLPSPSARLPEGYGLSARHPGDRGMRDDPAVLLVEDFEASDLSQIVARWDQAANPEGDALALSSIVPPSSSGARSLRIRATLGRNTGGYLYTRLPRGVEAAFLRFYVSFPSEAGYVHHFVHLGGFEPPTPYAQGGAGLRPRGDDRVTVCIEPTGLWGRYPPPGAWHLYCYWHEMKMGAGGNYWGNGLWPAQDALAPRDRWQCVEVMLKLNSTPDSYDGELALWLDGKLQAHFTRGANRTPWNGIDFRLTEGDGEPFEGFRWRTSDQLKINFLWLLLYVTEQAALHNRVADPDPITEVWFDDVVVATEYIGPVKPLGDG
jgi:hypothetical protein